MASHVSAEKRARQAEKRRARNHARKSAVRTVVKQVRQALEKKDQKQVAQVLPNAISALAKGASKGAIHKRAAARRISRLTKAANALKISQS